MNPVDFALSQQPRNEIMDVTPALASQWLENNEGNRRLNWNFISQLARDMKAGRFVCTHQGIAFDIQGRLIDGQHRLWAVLEAEVTVRMRVFFNESPENILHIDGNCPRQMADRMTMGRTLGTVRSNELATLRAMVGGIGMVTRRRTVQEEIALFEMHRDAVRFTHEHLPATRPAGISNAMTRAAIARAYYCTTEYRLLERFCEVLRTGASAHDGEHLIVLLRNHLLDLRRQGTTQWGRQRQYGLVSRALTAYLRHESLTVLRAATAEMFLLPEEVPAHLMAKPAVA
jgi:hypothetical protein